MKRFHVAVASAVLMTIFLQPGVAVADDVDYELIVLPKPSGIVRSVAVQVNDRRQISGTVDEGGFFTQRPVRWDVAADGSVTLIEIGLVAGRPTFGAGLNNLGHLAGTSFESGSQFAFRWTGGAPVQLENGFETPPDGGTFSFTAADISDDGWLCGSASASADVNVGPWNAVVWDEDGTMQALGTLGGEWSLGFAMNDRHVVTGRSEFSFSTLAPLAFRWTAADGMESLGVLPGHQSSQGRGLNNVGDVVGTSSAGLFVFDPDTLGVVWFADGTTRTLDPIGTPGTDDLYSDGFAINDAGWVVGNSSLGTFLQFAHPILWLPDGSKVDLLPLLPSGADWASAVSISNSGWITGLYRVGGRTAPPTAYVLRPTPATQLAMLGDQLGRADLGKSAKALRKHVEGALAKLTDDNPSNDPAASALLEAFVREIEKLARKGELDEVAAASLLAVANDALAALEE